MRWWIGVLLFLANSALAQTLPEPVRVTITDQADILDDTQEDALHQRLTVLRAETGIELAVLTLRSQQPYAPDAPIEAFATDVFNAWGIGSSDRNDGILVLILSEDRAIRIELGKAYGRDWDRTAATILNRSVLPAFAEERYADGIFDGVEDLNTSLLQPYLNGEAAPGDSRGLTNWMVMLAFGGTMLLVMRRRIGNLITRFKRCPNCGNRALSREEIIHNSATSSHAGEGERLTKCSQCTYRNGTRYRIAPRNTRHATTGRGSFGGGRSGGGGASGRW
jgi:uncharacterized protein